MTPHTEGPPTRSNAVNRVAVLLTIALAALSAAGLALFPPADGDGIPRVAVRALLVYPGWLLLPAAPWIALGLALRRRALCPAAFPVAAALGSVVVHALHLGVLRPLGLLPTPLGYVGIPWFEAAAALPLLWVAPPLRIARLRRPEWAAIVASLLLLAAFGAWWAPSGARRLSAYWYHPAVDEGWDASPVRLDPDGAWGEPIRLREGSDGARRYQPSSNALTLTALDEGTTTIVLLLQAEVGARLTALRRGREIASVAVERAPVEDPDEGRVLRYVDAGIAPLIVEVDVAVGDRIDLQIDAARGFLLFDASGSSADAAWTLELGGLRHVHYYQLLNITENVVWADELLSWRALTLHQPPLWSYMHVGAALIGGPDLPAVYFVFLLVLAGLAVVGVRTVEALEPGAPLPALLLPLTGAVCIGEHVVRHSEANFPDNLFTLALALAMLGLARGERPLFGWAGLAASVLRYPGAVVASGAALLLGALQRDGRGALRDLRAMWLPLGVFCAAMLLIGGVTGRLDHWLWILHFETFPEHYHGEYGVASLLSRVPGFYAELLRYAAYVPLFALPLAGRGSRWLVGVALGYSLLLCTIDHRTIHYHLPLIALLTTAAGCNAAALTARHGRALGYAVGGVALALGLVLPRLLP